MKTRDLLEDHIANRGLCPGASTVDEWLGKNWLEVRIGQRSIPVFPLWGLKPALIAHDVHHALTDYPTSLKGECEVAAWELASGGCRWNPINWVDRLTVFVLGLVIYPSATVRALLRGWGVRNLYGMNTRQILASDLQALRERMGLAPTD